MLFITNVHFVKLPESRILHEDYCLILFHDSSVCCFITRLCGCIVRDFNMKPSVQLVSQCSSMMIENTFRADRYVYCLFFWQLKYTNNVR